MARYAFPRLFELEMASAIGTRKAQSRTHTHGQLWKKMTHKFGSFIKFPEEWIAVALRWRLDPFLGIPQQPFNVYRRIADGSKYYEKMGINKTHVHNNSLSLRNDTFYDVIFKANNIFGSNATITALDDLRKPILGESVTVLPGRNAIVRFRAPNIAFIKVDASIEVSNFNGITMDKMVNLDDWKLVEKVGLPYKKGQVDNPIYNTEMMQGRINNLLEGDNACKFRVDLAKIFFQPPPTSSIGINIPLINAPKGEEVYLEITQGQDSLLNLLTRMFKDTSQGSFFKRQVQYKTKLKGSGIHQPSSSVSTDDTQFEIPLAGTTLLSAAMDMWASLGLGFGTTDIVDHNEFVHNKFLEPNRVFRTPYDYMVSSKFTLPGNLKREIAALSRYSPLQDVLQTPLKVNDFSGNRPQNRDGKFSEDLELKWVRVPEKLLPSSYIFAKSDNGINAKIMSEKRPFTSNSYFGFIPAINPEQDATHQLIASYIDQLNVVPFSGSNTLTYFKAATDVFGRWSDWVNKSHLLHSKSPHMPALLNVDFKLDESMAVGKVISGNLEIQVAWDWEDRSPKFFEIVGKFINPKLNPGDIAPAGFQKSAGAGFSSVIKITFNSTNLNHHPSASSEATVKKLPHIPEDGQNRKYLITIKNIKVDFGLMHRHGFAAYARASERVNPILFSDYSPYKKGEVNNPLPADPIAIVGPDINWTALPDATGFARYHLQFSSVPDTIGYVLYEATELALRDAIGLPDLESNNIIDRASALLANELNVKTKDAFIRKNRDLLEHPKATVNLPAVASGLYVYCISSMTSEQVESAKSNWLLVAVPHRTAPAPPILSAKNITGGVELSIEPYGATPSRTIELYRTRSELLVTDINVMGKPVAYDSDPRWQKLDNNGVSIVNPVDYASVYKLVDTPKPSWLPYYYRSTAFGEHDVSNGVIKGRSKSSNLIQITSIPPNPPDLEALSVSKSSTNLKVSFKSNAERWDSPLGAHIVKLLTVDRSAAKFEEFPHIEMKLPNIVEQVISGEFRRVSLDNAGRWLYESFIPMTDNEVIIRIIDPKFRISELRTKYVNPPRPSKLDIISLIAKRNAKRLRVTFKSSVPVFKPRRGMYLLEIFKVSGRKSTLLLKINIHEIKFKRQGSRFRADLIITPSNRVGLTTIDSGRTRPRLNLVSKMTIFRSSNSDAKGRYSYTATISSKSNSLLTNPFIKSKIVVKISVTSRKSVQKEVLITNG